MFGFVTLDEGDREQEQSHHSLHRQKRIGTNAAMATKIGKSDVVSSEYGFWILGCSRFFLGVLLNDGCDPECSSFSIGFSSVSSSSTSSATNGGNFGTSV